MIDTSGADFYPTPTWATHALIDNEPFVGSVWECACGDGSMSEVLKTRYDVISTDLYDRGYGKSEQDFLTTTEQCDNIITNPPFKLAEDFLKVALRQSDKKVALLLRLAFLESQKRYHSVYMVCPPSTVWVFSERITFYPQGKQTGGSGTIAYAWFVWDKGKSGATKLRWLKPGYKKQYNG